MAAFRDESAVLNLCVHHATKLTRKSATQVHGGGLSTRIIRSPEDADSADVRIITAEKSERWIVPVSGKEQQTIVVEYAW